MKIYKILRGVYHMISNYLWRKNNLLSFRLKARSNKLLIGKNVVLRNCQIVIMGGATKFISVTTATYPVVASI